MSGPVSQPTWEFLLSASRNSLQSFELSRLSHAASLRKEMAALLDQWIEENAAAMLARWLLEQRDRVPRVPEALSAQKSRINETQSVSDNFFTDRTVAQPANSGPI